MCDYAGGLSQMSLQQRRHGLVTLLTRWQAFKENKRDRSPSKQSDTMLDPCLRPRLCAFCCSSDYACFVSENTSDAAVQASTEHVAMSTALSMACTCNIKMMYAQRIWSMSETLFDKHISM